jgi:HPt (histidine-containing phosphotransfer) domain-containing protein
MGFAAIRTDDKSAEIEPIARARDAAPIDLVHLARQTMGDRELEQELLALFDRQAEQIGRKLRHIETGAVGADLAHKLKGSARAVGATAVAAAAENYEHGARAGMLRQSDADRLGASIDDLRSYLRDLAG